MKKKDAKIHFISVDTQMYPVKTGRYYCLAFDTQPTSKQKMVGIGISDPNVAHFLASYFKQMAKALEGTEIHTDPKHSGETR